MFSGIIQAVGEIARVERRAGDVRLIINANTLTLTDVAVGDSVAVSGVCLTVIELDGDCFATDVSLETLARTTLVNLQAGDAVNLEKSLRLADRLGGHLVSGHVDAVGRIVAMEPAARSQRWIIEAPAPLERYIAAKGSICIDGVSLTVNAIAAARFAVNLIPHTLEVTTFHRRQMGDMVNLEVDLIARYVERLLVAGDGR